MDGHAMHADTARSGNLEYDEQARSGLSHGTTPSLGPRHHPPIFSHSIHGVNHDSHLSPRTLPQSTTIPSLNSAKSQPILASRPIGSVKDIANKFDRNYSATAVYGILPEREDHQRQRRPIGNRTLKARSSRNELGTSRSPKRRTADKSPHAAFDSTSSETSLSSANWRPRHAPDQKGAGSDHTALQPLFGEVTPDGWPANAEHLSHYASHLEPNSLVEIRTSSRRQSDGHAALTRNEHASTALLSPRANHTLRHRRSNTDIEATATAYGASTHEQSSNEGLDNSQSQMAHTFSATSALHFQDPGDSRLNDVVDQARTPPPRSSSAAPFSTSARSSKSPARRKEARTQDRNLSNVIPRGRYQPPPLQSSQTQQMLSAKIVAPLPKLSPPLRSSRPRLPVSSASTSASRARITERFEAQSQRAKSPNDQATGQMTKSTKVVATRRQIPELEKVDFAARRARIQKAISQNLSENGSTDDLRAHTQPSVVSREMESSRPEDIPEYLSGNTEQYSESGSVHPADGLFDKLVVDTTISNDLASADPLTAHTTFEEEDSPVLGHHEGDGQEHAQLLELLNSAVYQSASGHSRNRLNARYSQDNVAAPRPLFHNVAGSDGDTEFADDISYEDSPTDAQLQWSSPNGVNALDGSIRIVLEGRDAMPRRNTNLAAAANDDLTRGVASQDFDAPITRSGRLDVVSADENVLSSVRRHDPLGYPMNDVNEANPEFLRLLEQYQSSGKIPSNTLQQVHSHMIDLHRMSANGGSDGFMVQNLLESVLQSQQPQERLLESLRPRQQMPLEVLPVTPDTPPDALNANGTAVVFSTDEEDFQLDEADDFESSIRKADAEWDRQQRAMNEPSEARESTRPPPPPKDLGYTPRSSTDPSGIALLPDLSSTLHHSQRTSGGPSIADPVMNILERDSTNSDISRPLLSPPPELPSKEMLFAGEALRNLGEDFYNPRPSGELSTLQPSTEATSAETDDSARPHVNTTSSTSLTAASTRGSSIDRVLDEPKKVSSVEAPDLERKRLHKRRHIIRELLDTEYTYHQDLNIIEDIYKATAADLVSTEDKKILFGNCDEVEKFSLHFYDELRRAVATVYSPAKKTQWSQKRGSFSTTQSDATGQGPSGTSLQDPVDDEKDRDTTVGQTFLNNRQSMDRVYAAYLRNHDAANQRLLLLKNTPTIKCWLDECHNNASDITSAWDLDSLLVKPTQRVSKYPMLLQQLLETTPANHPDYEALKAAARESVDMLLRINDAKKRADLVDQIINGKTKDDVRTGLAKAFGRRTEKIKERVGIAEAFQDAAFDEIAHKFGGHFIRLQICMRDVQDYVHRIEKTIDQINHYAQALEAYADVAPSSLPEVESKWRRYCQAIREITSVAFPEHKTAVQKRVIQPMIKCIELHKGPQDAIAQRKKRIVDYAKCKSIEKRGEKPDKRAVEASDMYIALNDHLKFELPRLYALTATLVQSCLTCFLDIQLAWFNVWERKLRPTIDAIDIPASIAHIEPAFRPDFNMVKDKILELALCNGSMLAESSNVLSSTTTLVGDTDPSTQRSSAFDTRSGRTSSMTSDKSPHINQIPPQRYSSGYGSSQDLSLSSHENRMRSNSAYSGRTQAWQASNATPAAHGQWVASKTTPGPSRPPTATTAATASHHATPQQSARTSADGPRYSRPSSSVVPSRVEVAGDHRYSGMFTSALPTELHETTVNSTPRHAPDDMPVLFVCASLFEFSIDGTRKEAGYPYLTYTRGEVFDVVAQKGELWLAKNQDDDNNSLGWIWEQHFVILSNE